MVDDGELVDKMRWDGKRWLMVNEIVNEMRWDCEWEDDEIVNEMVDKIMRWW